MTCTRTAGIMPAVPRSVPERVDLVPGLRPDDPVGRDVLRLLEGLDAGLGLRPEDAVDAADVPAAERDPLLRAAHGVAGRAAAQDRLVLIGLVDVQPGDRADDPVDVDLLVALELLDRGLRLGSELAVHRAHVVPEPLERDLQLADHLARGAPAQRRFCHASRPFVVVACRSAREHAADERAPRDRAHDAVDGDAERLLKAAHRGVGLRTEDAIDRESLGGVAGEVAELELLLHAADGVALAALVHLDDDLRPGLRPDDPVDPDAGGLLHGPDRGLGSGTEDAVGGDALPVRAEQVLQRLDRVALVAAADDRPGLDA